MNKLVIRSQNKQKDNRNRADKKQCIHKVGSQKEDLTVTRLIQQKLFSRIYVLESYSPLITQKAQLKGIITYYEMVKYDAVKLRSISLLMPCIHYRAVKTVCFG